jgi:hypothetical protein
MSRTNDPTKFDDLRFRPFLVIEAYTHPEKGVRTETKGWQKEKNSQHVTEHPSVVDRVAKRTWVRAEVIIDIINDCVIKNRLRGDSATYNKEILEHYKKKYSEIVNRSKAVWAAQHAVELAKQKLASRRQQIDESDWQVI